MSSVVERRRMSREERQRPPKRSRTTREPRGRSKLPLCSLATFSSVTAKQSADHRAEPGDFSRHSPTQKKTGALVVQAKTGGEAQRPAGGHIPGRHRRQIMRSVVQSETVAVAQAAVHFRADDKIFAA